jgi:AraC-like DNA-binding protein
LTPSGGERSKVRTNDNLVVDDPRLAMAQRLADPFAGEALFDHVTDIVYFVKNEAGQYVSVNHTLVDRCGANCKRDLLGKTAREIFPHPDGDRFVRQDRYVIDSKQPLTNELEQHAYSSDTTGWCLTTKLPLTDRSGAVIGLIGMSRDLQSPGEDSSYLNQLATLIDFIKSHLSQTLRTSDLASMVGMSNYQFDRRCRDVYGVTPSQLILQLRMGAAATKLRQSAEPIVSIALAVGYSDQSAFTRQFRRTFGVSPGKYRG